MGKLQCQVSRKVGNTEYKKFWIVIPNKILKEINWEVGQLLDIKIKNDKLIISKQK